jgi:hypothetical protein
MICTDDRTRERVLPSWPNRPHSINMQFDQFVHVFLGCTDKIMYQINYILYILHAQQCLPTEKEHI